MLKSWENNGTEEIGLVAPTPVYWMMLSGCEIIQHSEFP